MLITTAIIDVVTREGRTPEQSLQRLNQAATLPDGALRALITLTAMAHPIGGEGDVVGASFFVSELETLEQSGYIRQPGSGRVALTP